MAALAISLIPALLEDIPAIGKAFGLFKSGNVQEGVAALQPTITKALPALSAAASGAPPLTINLGQPGTYAITITVATKG